MKMINEKIISKGVVRTEINFNKLLTLMKSIIISLLIMEKYKMNSQHKPIIEVILNFLCFQS
jgi:hypothetical protein